MPQIATVSATVILLLVINIYSWSNQVPFPTAIIAIVTMVLVVISFRSGPGARVGAMLSVMALVIILGTPLATTAWDARMMWFFHGKRIYYDNTLFAQLDDYAPDFHNDYPILIPAMEIGRAHV